MLIENAQFKGHKHKFNYEYISITEESAKDFFGQAFGKD